MGYFFNKTSLLIVVLMVVISVISANEIAKLITKMQFANAAAYAHWLSNQREIFPTQEECQRVKISICEFKQCDFIPVGSSVEEVCGKEFSKGWAPTNVEIPELYRNIQRIRLTLVTAESTGTIEILPQAKTISYTSATATSTGAAPQAQAHNVEINEITRITNKMVLFDIANTIDENTSPDRHEERYELYIQSIKYEAGGIFTAGTSIDHRMACSQSTCRRTFTDIVREIINLWDGPVQEYSDARTFE